MPKWNVSNFYLNDQAWNHDYELIKTEIDQLGNFKGKLGNFNSFKLYHEKETAVLELLFKLYPYAHLLSDLDLRDADKSALNQKVMFVLTQLNQVTSFVAPEIIALGKDMVMTFVNKDSFLKPYKFQFEKLFRSQKHILSDSQEKILANFSALNSFPTTLHQSLSVIDRKNEVIKLSSGEKVSVSAANYPSLIENSVLPKDRAKIFEALFKRYVDNKGAFAATYNLVLQQLAAKYKSRNYSSALEAALFDNNIPVDVYLTLKDVTYANTKPLRRYFKLRKKILRLKKHNFYDRLLPLAKNDKTYPYETALKMFFDSIDGLDAEFVKNQHRAMEDGYVDVFPTDGKRTGAYSSGFYGHHPYILLNHNDTLDAVFTLAHEAGHSAHTIFSNESQPMPTADYTIFVAEIASIFNEHILLDHLLSKAESKDEKIILLQTAIDNICGTFYRQTLFATFEYEANKLVENDTPISDQSLSKIFIDLYKHYYNLDITKEGGLQYEWAYIPHLYNSPFYVYQYATSFAASLKIYDNIKSGDQNAFENFKKLLKSGGSQYPVEQARQAGADLTDPKTFLSVFKRFNELVDLLEELTN